MAVLPTTRPSTFVSTTGGDATTTAVTNVNDASDATFMQSNASTAGTVRYALADMPANFLGMDSSFICNVRTRLSVTGDDTWAIDGFEIRTSGGTLLADGLSWGQAVSSASFITYQDPAGTITDSGTPGAGANTAANWNDAEVIVDWTRTANMGADGNRLQIADIWFTGAYILKPNLPPSRRLIDRRPRGNFITSTRF